MLARNGKGKTVRNYFIECEKKLKQLPQLSEMEMIAKIASSQVNTENRLSTLETKFDTVVTLESGKQRHIQKAISKRVYDRFNKCVTDANCDFVVEDQESAKKLTRKLFSGIHRELKNKFGVASYKDIKVSEYEEAMNYIENWIENKI